MAIAEYTSDKGNECMHNRVTFSNGVSIAFTSNYKTIYTAHRALSKAVIGGDATATFAKIMRNPRFAAVSVTCGDASGDGTTVQTSNKPLPD